ncbi:MAG: hypothetical protein ACYCU7_14275 [Acidimicrobiales bacterium]
MVFCGLVVAAVSLASCSNGSDVNGVVTSLAQRAQQASDDAVYLPVQVDGHWALSGPKGTWLQSSISSTSTPWRWRTYPCVNLDAALVPGLRSYMLHQIAQIFSGSLAVRLRTLFVQKLGHDDSATCNDANSGRIAEGPLGPILDTTDVRRVSVDGATARVDAQVHVTDWQGGVTHVPTSGNGRTVGWAVVPGLLNATYTLSENTRHQWHVTAMTEDFAPGHGP